MRSKLAATVVAAVVALIGGCGGGDDEPATERQSTGGEAQRTAPTKAEFIEQADEICAEAKRKLAPVSRAGDAKNERGDIEGAAGELRKAVRIADEQLNKLRGLTPPEADRAVLAKYFDTIAEQKGLIRRIADALEEGDEEQATALASELDEGQQRAQGLAQGYGFKECGSATNATL
jgi:hypothetical protein